MRAALLDPLKTFRWRVYINGFLRATFAECSGLKSQVEEVPYAEGGSDVDQKSSGRKQYENISLKTGRFSPEAPGGDDVFTWAMRIHELGAVGAVAEYRETIEIALHDNYDVECERYEVVNAWPSTWVRVPTLNTASEAMYEEVGLAHEGWRRIFP